jgi:cell division protein FtsW (lipid II flippase)
MNFWKHWFWKQNKEVLFIIIFSSLIGFIISAELSFVMQTRMQQLFLSFPLKYVIFCLVGIILFFIFSLVKWHKLRNWLPRLFYIILILTFITLLIGRKTNSVRRWIFIGPISIQTSEFLKVLVLYMNAYYLSKNDHKMCLVIIGISTFSLLLQPDLGMTLLLLSSSAVQIFAVYKNIKTYMKIFAGLFGLLLLSGIFLATYAKNRLLIFLGKKQGFQVIQGLKLLKQSSLFGSINNIYVPDSHCDFVFTEICGFFGIIIAIIIICLPLLLNKSIWSYFDVKTFENDEKQIFLLGLGAQYTIQTYIHILSNLVIIPTKGMNLPMISFGGSNVLSYFMLFGLISSITNRKDI